MPPITRRLALTIRAAIRRFGHSRSPAFNFTAGREGPSVRAVPADAAVEDGDLPATITLPRSPGM